MNVNIKNRLVKCIIKLVTLSLIISAAFELHHLPPRKQQMLLSASNPPATQERKIYITDRHNKDIELLAKTVWGEARGCSRDEWRLVIWTVLQRVDSAKWANDIEGVITAPNQFVGYSPFNPVDNEIYTVAAEEFSRWLQGNNPPTHPIYAPDYPYYFFNGINGHNWFREVW